MAIWAIIFHQTPLEVAQGDTCKAPNLAYPNVITRYISGIHLHHRLTHLVWPSDACQRVCRQQRSVVPEAAFLTAIMARWRVRRAPYRAQMCELTVILSIVVFYTCYLRDPRKFLIAYAWLKKYRSILECAVCAFQTTTQSLCRTHPGRISTVDYDELARVLKITYYLK